MKIQMEYGREALVLPGAVLSHIKSAPAGGLALLLTLAAAHGGEVDEQALADTLGLEAAALREALAYWQGVGVLSFEEGAERSLPTPAKTEKIPVRVKVSEVPSYTSDELTGILEKNKELAALIDECQRVLGRTFNMHDIRILVGLVDYFSFDPDYILILCSHCLTIGKTTMRYIEKMAAGLYDDGIHDAVALHDCLERRERMYSFEGQIRDMFGLAARRLSTKEKKYLAAWLDEFGYDESIVSLAYELTVDAIHEPSMAYANSILTRWHDEGLADEAAIRASIEAGRSKSQGSGFVNSFDTDDFFEAALQRSMGASSEGS